MMARFAYSTDVSVGSWIAPRLRGDFGAVGLVCPTGFEAYARVFHPVESSTAFPRPRTWAEVAAATGRVAHPTMQWRHISDGGEDGEPATGSLGEPSLAVLAAAMGGDAPVTIGVWVGYGQYNGSVSTFTVAVGADDGATEVPAPHEGYGAHEGYEPTFDVDLPSGPVLALPGREYALFRGTLGALREPGWRRESGWAWRWDETLNIAWPHDRSWFIASEIDFDSTIVGGSRALVDRVLASDLETAEVAATSDLSSEGDVVNRL
ncbi:hypothetical protein [Conyzicola sp.]|uniref:hypothetical protein n=1 Tax=Conyzicola sp. TaxID=1969404 RepID=UPI003989222F